MSKPNRDKRTNSGRKRYVRQVGDHFLALWVCRCQKTHSHAGRACVSCGGAVLTPEEKRDAVPPG